MSSVATIAGLAALGAVAADAGPGWLGHAGLAGLLGLTPFLAIAATSFAKIVVVLAILRSALGASGVPPTPVLVAVAAVLSIFVMTPVFGAMLEGIAAVAPAMPAEADRLGIAEARAVYAAAAPPLVQFLLANTPATEIEFFSSLAGQPAAAEPGLTLLVPAFLVGELMEAFWMGVLVFLPFLVIDIIVSITLLALGTPNLPPTAVSLPLKLLLFIAADGWHVLVQGLVVSYST